MRVDVIATPTELTTAFAQATVASCAVIDVVRATTTLALLGERGAQAVYAVDSVDAARALAMGMPGVLLAGEIGARTPEGFDFGNSPTAFAAATVVGRTIVLTTTNGTRALVAARIAGAQQLFTACLRNASAVARYALQTAGDGTFALICSGRSGRVALDDLYTAGVIVLCLRALGQDVEETEGARIAAHIASTAGDPLRVLSDSAAGQNVIAADLAVDLPWCAAVDATDIIPRVSDVGPDGSLRLTFG